MPRTVVARKTIGSKNVRQLASLKKNLKTKPGPRKTAPGVKQPRKTIRYRPVTYALREIRREQRSTKLSSRAGPLKELVRHLAAQIDDKCWLRNSTITAVQDILEATMPVILKQTMDRRVEALTPAELRKQTATQVMPKNILGAFKVWCDMHPQGDYLEAFKEGKKLAVAAYPDLKNNE
jgi:histone H3/H4